MKDHLAGDPAIEKALRFDALHAAEQLTGKSYKQDESVAALGIMMQMQHNIGTNQLLEFADDTTHGGDLDRYLRIVGEEGFQKVLEMPIRPNSRRGMETAGDRFLVFWHQDGILLRCDTYWGGKTINSADFYYNWKPSADWWAAGSPRVTSSGGWHTPDRLDRPVEPSYEEMHPAGFMSPLTTDPAVLARAEACTRYFHQHGVYIGNHDGREAIRHKLAVLRKWGGFVSPWVKRPFLWLLHYMDTKDDQGQSTNNFDHHAINAERIGLLPAGIKSAISP